MIYGVNKITHIYFKKNYFGYPPSGKIIIVLSAKAGISHQTDVLRDWEIFWEKEKMRDCFYRQVEFTCLEYSEPFKLFQISSFQFSGFYSAWMKALTLK